MYLYVIPLIFLSLLLLKYDFQDLLLLESFKKGDKTKTPLNFKLSCQKNDSLKSDQKRNDKSNEIEYSNDFQLNLRTLEFITFLESKLGHTLSSNALKSENLEDILEIKKKVQQNILNSTSRYLKK